MLKQHTMLDGLNDQRVRHDVQLDQARAEVPILITQTMARCREASTNPPSPVPYVATRLPGASEPGGCEL